MPSCVSRAVSNLRCAGDSIATKKKAPMKIMRAFVCGTRLGGIETHSAHLREVTRLVTDYCIYDASTRMIPLKNKSPKN